MPLIALRTAPWKLQSVPLFRRSPKWRGIIIAIVASGAIVILALWACFLGNYSLTRDVYFTLAIAHVLAEFPFLLRTF
jgi:multidrug resistance efflux pump